ncbi:MAG: Smr/MutS family protein [Oligoflexales bacterium]
MARKTTTPKPQKNHDHDDIEDHKIMEEWLENWDGSIDKEETSLPSKPKARKARNVPHICLDLHGLTTVSANDTLDRKLKQYQKQHGEIHLKIITGRGIHSPGQPVLATEVYNYVQRCYSEWIVFIESSPMETQLGGLPLRGWFQVHLKFR